MGLRYDVKSVINSSRHERERIPAGGVFFWSGECSFNIYDLYKKLIDNKLGSSFAVSAKKKKNAR